MTAAHVQPIEPARLQSQRAVEHRDRVERVARIRREATAERERLEALLGRLESEAIASMVRGEPTSQQQIEGVRNLLANARIREASTATAFDQAKLELERALKAEPTDDEIEKMDSDIEAGIVALHGHLNGFAEAFDRLSVLVPPISARLGGPGGLQDLAMFISGLDKFRRHVEIVHDHRVFAHWRGVA